LFLKFGKEPDSLAAIFSSLFWDTFMALEDELASFNIVAEKLDLSKINWVQEGQLQEKQRAHELFI
jgi:hypothetical protein